MLMLSGGRAGYPARQRPSRPSYLRIRAPRAVCIPHARRRLLGSIARPPPPAYSRPAQSARTATANTAAPPTCRAVPVSTLSQVSTLSRVSKI